MFAALLTWSTCSYTKRYLFDEPEETRGGISSEIEEEERADVVEEENTRIAVNSLVPLSEFSCSLNSSGSVDSLLSLPG